MRADAEVLLRGHERLVSEDADLLEDIVAEANHMSTLANNMLTLARLDTGSAHREHEVVNLAELAQKGLSQDPLGSGPGIHPRGGGHFRRPDGLRLDRGGAAAGAPPFRGEGLPGPGRGRDRGALQRSPLSERRPARRSAALHLDDDAAELVALLHEVGLLVLHAHAHAGDQLLVTDVGEAG